MCIFFSSSHFVALKMCLGVLLLQTFCCSMFSLWESVWFSFFCVCMCVCTERETWNKTRNEEKVCSFAFCHKLKQIPCATDSSDRVSGKHLWFLFALTFDVRFYQKILKKKKKKKLPTKRQRKYLFLFKHPAKLQFWPLSRILLFKIVSLLLRNGQKINCEWQRFKVGFFCEFFFLLQSFAGLATMKATEKCVIMMVKCWHICTYKFMWLWKGEIRN